MHNANIPVFEIFNSESCLGRLVNMCIVPRVISVFICNMSGEGGGGEGFQEGCGRSQLTPADLLMGLRRFP